MTDLQLIEDIMKPYFDKKEREKNSKVELNVLKLRLEKLIENKDKEIEEYINNYSNSNFYSSYGSVIRKDLEQAYQEKENSLKQEIEYLEKNKFHRLDLREMAEIKENIRKELYRQRRQLDLELRQQQLNFDSKMLDLSNFKYKYNDQQQVINGSEWRTIYEESNEASNKINQIKNAIKKVEEYLNLTELTKDESSAIMITMTSLEREEYDRRKKLYYNENLNIDKSEVIDNNIDEINDSIVSDYEENKQNNVIDEVVDNTEDKPEVIDNDINEINDPIVSDYEENKQNNVIDEVVENTEDEPEVIDNDIIEINDPIISDYEEKDGNIIVDNMENLLKTIYNDIVNEAKNIKSIKINEKMNSNDYYISSKTKDDDYQINGTINGDLIQLPCGEYLDSNDIIEAIDNLYKKQKERKYIVKENKKEYKISKFTIEKLKRKLKKLTTAKLIKEKKVSKLDLLRSFGKAKADKIINEIDVSSLENKNIDEGEYINRNELIANLDSLFTTKKIEWLKKLSNKLKTRKNKIKDTKNKNNLYEDTDYRLELDDDYHIIKK